MNTATEEVKSALNRQGGMTAHNFEQVSLRGFGDPLNSYAHSMEWYKHHLFVGTTHAHLFQLMAGIRVIPEMYPKTMIYPVDVPANHYDIDLRAQIWRYNPGAREWKKVYQAPYVEGRDGQPAPLSMGFRVMRAFQGASDPEPALYTISVAPFRRPEAVMLRSSNGSDFEIVSEPGLGITNPVPRSLRTLIPFKGRLFTSPVMGQQRGQVCTFGRAVVYSNKDPAHGKWELSSPLNFGNPNNMAVFTMGLFNNHVYAGTINIEEGFELWKTKAEGDPPFEWKRVLTRGAYRGKCNQAGGILGYIGDCAYVGTGIQNGGYDRTYKVGPAAPELIRLYPDDTWEVIVGEPRETPDGLKVPLSGMGPGFNRLTNGYYWHGCSHERWLYVGTFNWGTYTLFAKIGTLPKQFALGMEAFQRFIRKQGGFQIWRSADGVSWVPVTRNGFGNYWDTGVRTMASTPEGLFIGTLGSFGPEVATKRIAGWRYEHNPDSGLLIYLGNPARPAQGTEEPWRNAGRNTLMSRARAEREKGSTDAIVETVLGDYYGGSDFRHVGFWREDISDPRKACENLMQEIIAFLPDRTGKVLDLCCGRGATTRHLTTYFAPESIVGIAEKKGYLIDCQHNAPDAAFMWMRLPQLKLPSESFDYIICVEGLSRCKRPAALVREMYRLLRPGGRFVFSDLVTAGSKGRRWLPARLSGDKPQNLEQYKEVVTNAGFHDITAVDVTAECWIPFNRHVYQYLQAKIIAQEITKEIARNVVSLLPGGGEENAPRYILVSAAKAQRETGSVSV